MKITSELMENHLTNDPSHHPESFCVTFTNLYTSRYCQATDEFRICVSPALLRLVHANSPNFICQMLLSDIDKATGSEVRVIPGHLIPQHRRPLKRPEPLLRDGMVILMRVMHARQKNHVGFIHAGEFDHASEDLLAQFREAPHLKVIYKAIFIGHPNGCRGLKHFCSRPCKIYFQMRDSGESMGKPLTARVILRGHRDC